MSNTTTTSTISTTSTTPTTPTTPTTSTTTASTANSMLDPGLHKKYHAVWGDLRHYINSRHFIPPKKGQIVETKIDTFLVKESAVSYAEYYL